MVLKDGRTDISLLTKVKQMWLHYIKMEILGGEEMVQCLGALVALVEDLGLVPNTCFVSHNLPLTSESTMHIGGVHKRGHRR